MSVIKGGMVCEKIGVTTFFDSEGNGCAATVLSCLRNVVVAIKNQDFHGYSAIVVGYGDSRKPSRSLDGLSSKLKLDPFLGYKEFRVNSGHKFSLGQVLPSDFFSEGQSLDISGRSSGKGYAGVMKRHNFSGLEASHGVSKSHRSGGSTGQRQDPGRVFKGKKMAGRMGGANVTIQGIKVLDIDVDLGLLVVRGGVPGKPGGLLYVSNAVKSS